MHLEPAGSCPPSRGGIFYPARPPRRCWTRASHSRLNRPPRSAARPARQDTVLRVCILTAFFILLARVRRSARECTCSGCTHSPFSVSATALQLFDFIRRPRPEPWKIGSIHPISALASKFWVMLDPLFCLQRRPAPFWRQTRRLRILEEFDNETSGKSRGRSANIRRLEGRPWDGDDGINDPRLVISN